MKNLFMTLLAFGTILTSKAVTIDNTEGRLSFAEIDKNETNLVLTGTVNALDFDFIFKSLTNLKSLDLSDATITSYSGDAVLLGRTNFEANMLPDYCFAGSKIEQVVLPGSLTAIGDGVFSSSALKTIVLPEGLTTISESAFNNCKNLREITIPARVKVIGSNAFAKCESLETVSILSNLEVIKDNTFSGCVALKSVNIPSILSQIGVCAFENCSSLQTLNVPETLTFVGERAFAGSGITEIDFSKCHSLKMIGAWAFSNCSQLTSVIMSDATMIVGEGAFFDSAIENYNTPEKITFISDFQFKGANNLSGDEVLPEGVEAIGKYAFMGWDKITDFEIPSTVNTIEDNAFEGWTALASLSVVALSDVPELGQTVWEGVDQSEVTLLVREGMEDAFKAAEQWRLFKIDTTGITDSQKDDVKSSNIKVYFDGETFRVRATENVAKVFVADIAGKQYLLAQPNTEEYSVPVADWNANVYIIAVKLSDGTEGTYKLVKK